MSFDRQIKTCIKIIKNQKKITGMPSIKVLADFPCEVIDNKPYFYELESEYVFFISHPPLDDANLLDIVVSLSEENLIDKIIIDNQYLDFIEFGKKVKFSLTISELSERTHTLEIHSLLREGGQIMRIEHNQPDRLIGEYTEYPETEVKAALHYMSASREILRLSGAAKTVEENKLGHFLILGFETNNFMHKDFPPHWHLILRWPYRAGSQAPHIYLDKEGKNVSNRVSIDCMPKLSATYNVDEWFGFVDMYGKKQLFIKVDDDGGYSLTNDKVTVYKVAPYKSGSGVSISMNGHKIKYIFVDDNSSDGKMTIISQSSIDETYLKESLHYDPHTGKIFEIETDYGKGEI
ncbi:hypothetical protein [Jeotgalicoccus sp. ATCC 8456]|uniref:hypothetical protein n=1 Tax=Jeotgalicoccus sp. ATCC 8456 TaxID=946435 RepID=UPI0018E657D8|nr:hypothetical protein [Jeotgalicoccus sp. ATCC 8456]QQD84473.1 hypothetical protein JEM45_07470 [Jeotgalicoccus sp. ATCC 8456]